MIIVPTALCLHVIGDDFFITATANFPAIAIMMTAMKSPFVVSQVGCRCAGEENLRDYEGYSFED